MTRALPRESKPKKPRSRVTLVFFGVVLALLLFAGAEILLRVLGLGAARELREFADPAGTDGPFFTREPNWPQFAADPTLSLDRIATPKPKADGTYRIIVVGESTVAGFPFYPQLSFARFLEASLRDAFPELAIEVVNLGRAADPSDAVAETAIEALALAPDALVVCSGHNEYQASYVDDLRDGFWPRMRAQLRNLRLVRIGFSRVLSRDAPKPALPADRIVGEKPWLTPTEFARGEQRYRANLMRIITAARARAVDVVLMTQVANLRDFPPSYSHFTRKLTDAEEQEYERLLAELDRAVNATVVPADAERITKQLQQTDPGVARAVFLAGRYYDRAGRTADAALLYALALEADGYPNRARHALNLVIRRLAADQRVRLADAELLFANATRAAAPGQDLFLDHCHPTLEGMALLADALRPPLLELLARRGAPLPASFSDRPMLERHPMEEWLTRLKLTRPQLIGGAVRAAQGSLLVYLGLPANGEALELARRGFEEALRIAPDHVEAQQGLLVVEIAAGHRRQALEIADLLATASAPALKKVEDVSKAFPALQAQLGKMALVFRGGRLVPAE